jgi:hypothetical protein
VRPNVCVCSPERLWPRLLQAFVADLVPGAVLTESHGGHVKYTLPKVCGAVQWCHQRCVPGRVLRCQSPPCARVQVCPHPRALVCLLQNLRLSVLFQSIEGAKTQLRVSDYSVSQTTLEEVFLRFAREQEKTSSS